MKNSSKRGWCTANVTRSGAQDMVASRKTAVADCGGRTLDRARQGAALRLFGLSLISFAKRPPFIDISLLPKTLNFSDICMAWNCTHHVLYALQSYSKSD